MKLDINQLETLQKDGCLTVPSFCVINQNELPDLTDNVRFCLEKFPELKVFSQKINELIRNSFPGAQMIRSILFNKSADCNWSVRWHQDSTICVREKIELESFGPWSVKDGIDHVKIPPEYLDCMVTARLHLDKADSKNGALQVVPGSHKNGFIEREKIRKMADNAVICKAEAGDLLLMKPLILHHSEHSDNSWRRVLHLEFLYKELPGGLVPVKNP